MTSESDNITSETMRLIEQARNLLHVKEPPSNVEIETLKNRLQEKEEECCELTTRIQELQAANQELKEEMEKLAQNSQKLLETLRIIQQNFHALSKRHLEMTGEDFCDESPNDHAAPSNGEEAKSQIHHLALLKSILQRFDSEGIQFEQDALELFVGFLQTLMHQDEKEVMEACELLLNSAKDNQISTLTLQMIQNFIGMFAD